jgi:predicted aconitase
MPDLGLHKDEDRFWRDFANVMSRASTDKESAFCVGLVAAIAAFDEGFPDIKTMRLAARQDAKALAALLRRTRRMSAAAKQTARETSAPQAGKGVIERGGGQ